MSVFSMAGSNPALPTYPLQRSVRLRSSNSAYFNRTPSVSSNQRTWTWSGWVKIGNGTDTQVFGAASSTSTVDMLVFGNSGLLYYSFFSGAYQVYVQSTAVFRDPSAWYHVVLAVDTTQATATNRVRTYVNGVQQSLTPTYGGYGTQNLQVLVNSTIQHNIGRYPTYTAYFDGYLTEINFLDGYPTVGGTTYDATSWAALNVATLFGAYNSYGVWSTAKYTGTYGTNGYYLNFQDNSAVTTTANVGIGKDSSGNGNYWTSNGINVTAYSGTPPNNVSYDSMLDVPTLTSATNANFPVLNPLIKQDTGYTTTISGANLNASITYSSGANMVTIPVTMSTGSSGKWYFEVTATSTQPSGGSTGIGVSTVESTTVAVNLPRNSYIYVGSDGSKTSYTGTAVNAAYGASYTTNDVIGVALNIDAGTLTFYKNNTSQGTAFTGLAAGNYFPIVSSNGTGTRSYAINCGQRPFSYTPPAGFVALNTYNLPDSIVPVGAQYMAATTFNGVTGGSVVVNTVNGIGFKPDFVWMKCRNVARNNELADSVRGTPYASFSNLTNAEATDTRVSSFNSNGWTVGVNSNSAVTGDTEIGWSWRASNASAVTNTAGTITSQVSANPTAGFSIVTYTGTLTTTPGVGAMPTVGHGLNAVPKLILSKSRNVAGVDSGSWAVFSGSIATDSYLRLNTTAATASVSGGGGGTMVAPTSSVFSTPYISGSNINANNYVAYCFAAVPGYSAFGSYTGNGSTDGPFVYLGFRPRWLLIKSSSFAAGWSIWDTSRNTYNVVNNLLLAESNSAELSYPEIDILSNGFKLRGTNSTWNGSGQTYIYAAFAENPFKNALAR